jgi:hypothetical protein
MMPVGGHCAGDGQGHGSGDQDGRPAQGKARYNVMLTVGNVAKAREQEGNFSGLLNRLLAEWVER